MAPFLVDETVGSTSADVALEDQLNVNILEPTQVLADSLKPAPANVETKDEWVYPYPTDFKLSEKPIDEHRDLKVRLTTTVQESVGADMGRSL